MTYERPARSATILFVDDDPILLDLMRRFLTFGGYTAITASSAEAAERLFQERSGEIDLAILDLHMPGLNGLELLARLRARQPHLKALLMTGFNSQAVQDRSGISKSHILRKPFDMTAVLDKIRAVLDSSSEK